jgi:hypothetical protein
MFTSRLNKETQIISDCLKGKLLARIRVLFFCAFSDGDLVKCRMITRIELSTDDSTVVTCGATEYDEVFLSTDTIDDWLQYADNGFRELYTIVTLDGLAPWNQMIGEKIERIFILSRSSLTDNTIEIITSNRNYLQIQSQGDIRLTYVDDTEKTAL